MLKPVLTSCGAFACALVVALTLSGTGLARHDSRAATRVSCPTAVGGLNLTTATIPQLRAALDSGQITSAQLVLAYLDRIHALNLRGPRLRPVIRTTPNALAQAQAWDAAHDLGQSYGPLAGIPVLLKDNLDTRDMQTTAGAKAMRGAPPRRDAFLAARLRQAGAIVLGKTNMDEWATTISKEQPHGFSDVGGQTLDPYTRGDPSGSSGGSAVSATSGLAGSTVGTETSGSIIDPAWVNSAVGIKPTRGLVSRGGVIPLLEQYDTPGPIDQNVTDAALMLGLMTGVDPRDPLTKTQVGHAFGNYTQFLQDGALTGARIGVPKTSAKHPLMQIVGLKKMEQALKEQGATIVPVDSTLLVSVLKPKVFADAFKAEFRKQLGVYLHQRGRSSPRHSFEAIVAYNTLHGRRAVRYGQDPGSGSPSRCPAQVGRPDREGEAGGAEHPQARRRPEQSRRATRLARHLGTHEHARRLSLDHSPCGYKGHAPYGAIFTGRPWAEPKLIGYAYDFEQATHAWHSPATIDQKFAAACSA